MVAWRNWAGFFIGFCLTPAATGAPPQSVDQVADARKFGDQFRPFLVRHCLTCHSGDKPKGDLRLDQLTPAFGDEGSRKQWAAILERIEAGEMPPKSKPRPPKKEVQALTDWLAPRLAAADAVARANQGRAVLRRLNRVEYENTVNDLLGIEGDFKKQLPADGSADGFDNAGAALHTSYFLMEKYLEAVDAALDMAITNRPKPPPLIKKRHSLKDGHPVRSTKEDVYRFLDDGETVCFCSSEWHTVWISNFYPPDAGNYRFCISASSFQSDGKPVTFRETASGTRLTGTSGLISYLDAPIDNPTVFEFVRYMEPRTSIRMLPYGLARAQTVKQVGGEKWDGPGLVIQYVEVEGPLYESWPPESHRRIFGRHAAGNIWSLQLPRQGGSGFRRAAG